MLFQSHDRNLINRCLQNNRLAQKELFDKYYKAMFNIALRIVKDEDLCYDVVQETFILVFNNLEQFQFKATIGSWIKTILVREAIRRMKINFGEDKLQEKQKEPIIWPEDLTGEYLNQAIMELPDGYRTVFTLIEIEGYSHKEVAKMMSITEGTSKSQLFYAKKSLQQKLSGVKY
jgi:RNA polymerase sigma-70 factor (ECF subfamily)